MDEESTYTDVATHGQAALPQFAQASQWAFEVLDELSDRVVHEASGEGGGERTAAAAATVADDDDTSCSSQPMPPSTEDTFDSAVEQAQHKQQPIQQVDEDALTVHVDLSAIHKMGESGLSQLLPGQPSPVQPSPPPHSAEVPALRTSSSTSAVDPSRTDLHSLAQAWLAALDTGDTRGDGSVDAVPDVAIERLFAAFDLSAAVVGGAIGAVMVASVKNDNGNMAVVRKALAKRYTDKSMQSLHVLLGAEVASKVHKKGASGLILRDPSCALSMVWLRRSLALQTGIIEGLVRERQQVRGRLNVFSKRI